MPETKALTADQRQTLRNELARPELTIFTAVRLARVEVAFGHFDAAMAYLSVDGDKLRTVSPALYELIQMQGGDSSNKAPAWLTNVQKFHTSGDLPNDEEVVTDPAKIAEALSVIADGIPVGDREQSAMLPNGAKAWKDVPNATAWVDNIRGSADE